MITIFRTVTAFSAFLAVFNISPTAFASGTHSTPHNVSSDDHGASKSMMDTMRESHSEHEHGHDFEAMEKLSSAELTRVVALLQDVGLVIPKMDAANGRKLFVETGCIVCHSVNKVGGDIGPSLNAADMPSPMNAFEFAARMWRGASSMAAMQQDIFGEVIPLTGQDLADLVAFAHNEKEQAKLAKNQIPKKFQKLLEE